MSDVLRVANCSGFYGDRFSAMREMLEGGSAGHGVDVITGDYLAELTMLIWARTSSGTPPWATHARSSVRSRTASATPSSAA